MRPRGLIVSFVVAVPLALVLGQAASGCVFGSADDCKLTLGFGCDPSSGSSSSGTGGTNTGGMGTGGVSSSSSGSTGGTGGMPMCVDPSLCPDPPPGPCVSLATKVCEKGKCAIKYAFGDASSQAYGSCKRSICDASGKATEVIDDTNVYDDGNPCTVETCSAGVPGQTKMIGMVCTAGGGGSGFCVQDPVYASIVTCAECDPNGAATCIGGALCSQGKCVPSHCKNGTQDHGESGVDCGGSTSGCTKCPTNKTCIGVSDCLSGVCTMMKCAQPSCSDGVQNGDETDTDCGGLLCGQPCAENFKCVLPSDCASQVCKGNVCQPASCTDGVQNGDETGVDCGGAMSMCPACP